MHGEFRPRNEARLPRIFCPCAPHQVPSRKAEKKELTSRHSCIPRNGFTLSVSHRELRCVDNALGNMWDIQIDPSQRSSKSCFNFKEDPCQLASGFVTTLLTCFVNSHLFCEVFFFSLWACVTDTHVEWLLPVPYSSNANLPDFFFFFAFAFRNNYQICVNCTCVCRWWLCQ